MRDHNITRLVVGQRMTLSMGVPVGQAVTETDVSKTLRWRNGRWERSGSLLAMAKHMTSKPASVLKIPVSRQRVSIKPIAKSALLLVAAMALAIGVAIWVKTYMTRTDVAQSLPFGAKTSEDSISRAVKSVNEPFPLPSSQQQMGGGPTVPEAAQPNQSGVLVPQISETSERQSAPATAPQHPVVQKIPDPKTKTDGKDQKQAPGAVVMDADVQPAKVPVSAAPKQPATTPAAAARQGTGLVALTPDGKYALFTNQKTRLPEKFAVGEKLPSGEIIKSIDKANGKVVTDAKEYRLE